eukprot:gene8534-2882_t
MSTATATVGATRERKAQESVRALSAQRARHASYPAHEMQSEACVMVMVNVIWECVFAILVTEVSAAKPDVHTRCGVHVMGFSTEIVAAKRERVIARMAWPGWPARSNVPAAYETPAVSVVIATNVQPDANASATTPQAISAGGRVAYAKTDGLGRTA